MLNRPMDRRSVLRGLGTMLGLPLFEAMVPAPLLAGAPKKPPVRLAFVYTPNGQHMQAWTPKETGADFEFPFLLEPLEPFKDQLFVLSGLTCDKARPNGD